MIRRLLIILILFTFLITCPLFANTATYELLTFYVDVDNDLLDIIFEPLIEYFKLKVEFYGEEDYFDESGACYRSRLYILPLYVSYANDPELEKIERKAFNILKDKIQAEYRDEFTLIVDNYDILDKKECAPLFIGYIADRCNIPALDQFFIIASPDKINTMEIQKILYDIIDNNEDKILKGQMNFDPLAFISNLF